jgi:hypothetical protein
LGVPDDLDQIIATRVESLRPQIVTTPMAKTG